MMISECFTLTRDEFDAKSTLFDILKVKAEEVVGKDYQYLNIFLTEHYYILKLVNFFKNVFYFRITN